MKFPGTLVLAAAFPGWTLARACPLCESDTGRRVREGIFGPDFGSNLAATLLPFLVFLGIAASIQLGGPSSRAGTPAEVGPDDPSGQTPTEERA